MTDKAEVFVEAWEELVAPYKGHGIDCSLRNAYAWLVTTKLGAMPACDCGVGE